MCSSATIHKYPEHPRAAVSAIVFNGPKILMVKRKNPPARGTWAPPGGSIHLGEACFDAVRREVLEETAIEVEPIKTITHVDAIYHDERGRVLYHYVILYIEARYLGGMPRPGDDASKVGWFSIEELEGMNNVEKQTLKILKALTKDIHH